MRNVQPHAMMTRSRSSLTGQRIFRFMEVVMQAIAQGWRMTTRGVLSLWITLSGCVSWDP
jgi:hypothetical protein